MANKSVNSARCKACTNEPKGSAKNKPCFKKACYKKMSYYKRHDYYKKFMRVKLYGITVAEYDLMVMKQGNKCAVCGEVMTTPCIDHNHSTGKVRELLCSGCNQTLGHIRENRHTALALAIYIDKHNT